MSKGSFKKIFDKFESLFMTNHKCISCGKERPDSNKFGLCNECLKNFILISGTLCEKCGEMIAPENRFCDRCKVTDFGFDKNISFAVYNDVSSRIVKRLKYGKTMFLADEIAKMIASLSGKLEDFDFVSFVPLGKDRFAERGFNQAKLIAEKFAKLVDKQVISTLDRCENEKHQAGLSAKDRMKNIAGSFALKSEAKEIVSDKTILVIDDVFTTGATLSECAKVLKKAGAKSVVTLTFAKTELSKL